MSLNIIDNNIAEKHSRAEQNASSTSSHVTPVATPLTTASAHDFRDLQDPTEGKGFIMHNVREFIREMTRGLFTWSEKSSIWPLTFGIKCCAIEMMAFGAARYDSDRLGVFFRASPRQADLLIVAGPATIKLKDIIMRLYDQMPEPKYVIAFGECAICGGPFYDSYSMINGVDKLIPVDVYVPGCPPRPEQLLLAIMKLQEIIEERSAAEAQAAQQRSTPTNTIEHAHPTEKLAKTITGTTKIVGMPNMSREEILAQIIAHPTYNIGHQSNTPRVTPSAEELLLATPTGQPQSIIDGIKKNAREKEREKENIKEKEALKEKETNDKKENNRERIIVPHTQNTEQSSTPHQSAGDAK